MSTYTWGKMEEIVKPEKKALILVTVVKGSTHISGIPLVSAWPPSYPDTAHPHLKIFTPVFS
jgi:hypothetical protein